MRGELVEELSAHSMELLRKEFRMFPKAGDVDLPGDVWNTSSSSFMVLVLRSCCLSGVDDELAIFEDDKGDLGGDTPFLDFPFPFLDDFVEVGIGEEVSRRNNKRNIRMRLYFLLRLFFLHTR